MTKRTKTLIIANFALWTMAMIAIILGILFVFIMGKGYETKHQELIDLGRNGATGVGGVLIAILAGIMGVSITFMVLKLTKLSPGIVAISFTTSLLISIIMIVMAILDIAHVWSIWPWIINFACLANFALVVLAFKQMLTKRTTQTKGVKLLNELNTKGYLTISEYNEIKARIKRIAKEDAAEVEVKEIREETSKLIELTGEVKKEQEETVEPKKETVEPKEEKEKPKKQPKKKRTKKQYILGDKKKK